MSAVILKCEVRDGVRRLSLNRPDKRNALPGATRQGVAHVSVPLARRREAPGGPRAGMGSSGRSRSGQGWMGPERGLFDRSE